eukprot:3350086-Prymnesium_polylepis.1
MWACGEKREECLEKREESSEKAGGTFLARVACGRRLPDRLACPCRTGVAYAQSTNRLNM